MGIRFWVWGVGIRFSVKGSLRVKGAARTDQRKAMLH